MGDTAEERAMRIVQTLFTESSGEIAYKYIFEAIHEAELAARDTALEEAAAYLDKATVKLVVTKGDPASGSEFTLTLTCFAVAVRKMKVLIPEPQSPPGR